MERLMIEVAILASTSSRQEQCLANAREECLSEHLSSLAVHPTILYGSQALTLMVLKLLKNAFALLEGCCLECSRLALA